MWFGPKLKFARARVSLEDAATLAYTNWGGDRWGHALYCNPVDYWCGPVRRNHPETTFGILPLPGPLLAELNRDPNELIDLARFHLRPHDAVPEGEVWVVPPWYLRSL